jgi:hypothetical protein
MRVKGTDCNGCPECINCGRNGWYYYHKCDRCGSTEQLYIWQHGEELCAECLLEEFEEVDMEE